MKNILKGFLAVNLPLHQSVRFQRHRRFNFKYVRPPHDKLALVEQVCRPVLKIPEEYDPRTPMYKTCGIEARAITESRKEIQWQSHIVVQRQLDEEFEKGFPEYEAILAKEVRHRLDHATWIAFFHKNPVDGLEFLDMQVQLKRQCNIKLFEYKPRVIQKAFEDTKYEPALVLFQSSTCFGIASELKVKELVMNLKKLPKIILIGGIIDNRLLTRAQIEYYASLPDITTLQSRLVSVLNTPAQNLIKHLTFHQRNLVAQLESYQRLLKSGAQPGGSVEGSSSSSSSESSSDSSDSDSDVDDKKK